MNSWGGSGKREREEGEEEEERAFHFGFLSCGGVRDCPPTLIVHQSSIANDNSTDARSAGSWRWTLTLVLVDNGGIGRWWTLVAMGVGGHCQGSAVSADSA